MITIPCPVEDELLEISPRTSHLVIWPAGNIGHLIIGGRHSFIEPADEVMLEACLLLGFRYLSDHAGPIEFREVAQACREQRLPRAESDHLRDQLILAGWTAEEHLLPYQIKERLFPLADFCLEDVLTDREEEI